MTHRRTIAVVQARMRSSRLPGKVLEQVGGRALVDWVVARARNAALVDEVVVAIPDIAEDDVLAAHLSTSGTAFVRGSETDVLSRFVAAVEADPGDVVVRLTADCPFLDPALVDRVVALRAERGADYATNTLDRRYPDGLDVEVFTRAALARADAEARLPVLREHVTPYLSGKRRDILPFGGFDVVGLDGAADFGHMRWTVDTQADLAFVRAVAAELGRDFAWLDVVALLTRRPELAMLNAGHAANEGVKAALATYGTGRRFDRSNQHFARAAETIPLASQTFSKSFQQWVKGASPLFVERGLGARAWDVDGNEYVDYVLGLLPVILGYRDPDVDAAIRRQLEKGIVFSLASPVEAELWERLRKHIPCAEMSRFGKNGSDATTAAIRLARAFTGREKVLVGGYHGWHDWYIGTTARDRGVPAAVKRLSAAFAFNDADALADALAKDRDGVAAVILEPNGASAPVPGFLERVRELCDRFGAVLVFDEIVSGFRVSMGGAQARLGVTPDLAAFGKAMANGMPISAVVGRADVMRLMEDVFVSSTFGGETLSIAAAIATIDKLEALSVPERLRRLGEELIGDFQAAASASGLADVVSMGGEGWWPRMKSRPPAGVSGELLTSLLRQEFAAAGLILGSSFNLCLAHEDLSVRAQTTEALRRAFAAVRAAIDLPDPAGALRGEPFRPTFSVR